MLRFPMLTLSCSLLFAASCLAQAIDPGQQLRTFGNRMVEGTWHQKFPANVDSKHTYLWALGNEYLLVYECNKDKPNALAVVGVDPKTKLQTWWRFQDDGSIHITSVDVTVATPHTDKVELAGERPLGTGSFDVTWKDDDTLEIIPQAGAQTQNANAGRELWQRSDDVDDLSWMNAGAPASIPKQLSLAQHLTGKKWIDGVIPEGNKFIGAGDGRWILGGKFHLYAGTTVMDNQTTWSHLVIMGIDPTSGKAATWEFSSSGARSDITYDDSGMTIYGDNVRSNGDKYSFEGKFTVDGDTLRYQSKIAQEGKEPLPYGWNYRNAQ